MDLTKIKEFIDLAKQEGLSELKYETDNLKIAIAFPTVSKNFDLVAPSYATQSKSLNEQAVANARSASADLATISSPFVGTFYTSPGPGKPTFAKVGDKVKKGQVLCILEAMKIMNEIESTLDGEIAEICLENESLVEYGQPLFRLRV